MRALALLPAAVALLLPAPALAGTVSFGTSVQYVGDADPDVVTVADAPLGLLTRVTVSEAGISTGGGCNDGGDTATCDVPSGTFVDIQGGGGGDTITSNLGRLSHALAGQGGGDTLTGSDASESPTTDQLLDTLEGGSEADRLFGRGGNDSLDPGSGDGDLADGGAGNDSFAQRAGDGAGDVHRGGAGFDTAALLSPAASFRVDLGAGTYSTVSGGEPGRLEAVENAATDAGNDLITGSDGANDLFGGAGNDRVDGGAGGDTLVGGSGADTLLARDGVNDRLTGGAGGDTCLLDQFDEHQECESVQSAAVRPFGTVVADQAGPRCRTGGLRSRVRRRGLARGLRFSVRCNERATLVATMVGRVRRLPKGVRFSTVGDVVLGTSRRRTRSGNLARFRMRASRRLRRSIRRGSRLRIDIAATDRFGNARTLTKRVRVRS